jgi:hypothetical protein
VISVALYILAVALFNQFIQYAESVINLSAAMNISHTLCLLDLCFYILLSDRSLELAWLLLMGLRCALSYILSINSMAMVVSSTFLLMLFLLIASNTVFFMWWDIHLGMLLLMISLIVKHDSVVGIGRRVSLWRRRAYQVTLTRRFFNRYLFMLYNLLIEIHLV